MSRATKRNSNLYAFLKAANVLSGSAEDIAQAKRDYWRQYRAKWRNEQRKRTKQYMITLMQKEDIHIAAFAKMHKRSITRFLKEAAFCYVDKKYMVVDEAAIGVIRQLLAMNYTVLQGLRDDEKISPDNGRLLLFRMAELEHTVLSTLNNPNECKTAPL